MDTMEQLNRLIEVLDTAAKRGRGDAIDSILAADPRSTGVQGMRDDETIVRFRQELVDGLIRVDTAGKLLNLVTHVVSAALALR